MATSIDDLLKLANISVQLNNAANQQDPTMQMAMQYLAQQQAAEQNSAQLGLSERQLALSEQELAGRTQNAELAAMMDGIRAYAQTVGADPERLLEMLAATSPQLGQAIQQGTDRATAGQVSALLPQMRNVYSTNVKTPDKIGPALDTLLTQAGIGWNSPAAQQIPWSDLNQEFWPGQQGGTQSATQVPDPRFTQAGEVGRRIGNTVGLGGKSILDQIYDVIPNLINTLNPVAEGALGAVGIPANFGRMPSWSEQWNQTAANYPVMINDLIMGTGQPTSIPSPSTPPQTPLLQSNQPLNIADIVRRNR